MSSMKQVSAVLEVTVATALTWATYKAMKLAEPEGFNGSPGLAMLVAASIMSIFHWREFTSYGIISSRWRSGMSLGVVITLLMLLGGSVYSVFFPASVLTVANMPIQVAAVGATIEIAFYLVFFSLLVRLKWQRLLERPPVTCGFSILVVLLIAAPAFAVYRGAPLSKVVGEAGSLVFFTGIGEEVFFRGYVQSRLNGVFGRPWRFLGASFGLGLFICSSLFGLIHVFNPTRPYEGHWELSWLWGASAFLGSLLYGYLRELTGSIWTAAIVHALSGEYRGLWQIFLSRR